MRPRLRSSRARAAQRRTASRCTQRRAQERRTRGRECERLCATCCVLRWRRSGIQKTEQGLVRVALKKAWSDGTVAVEMNPLSLLCRLAASVPPPKLHTVRYAGVLGSASRLRSRVVPTPPFNVPLTPAVDDGWKRKSRYRPWAEFMKRTLKLDVLECPRCQGRMKLLALVVDLAEAGRFAKGLGEPTDLPPRTPARGPPYWQSRVLRRLAGEAA